MATLTLDMDDRLMAQIANVAAQRGEDAAQFVVRELKKVLEEQATSQPTGKDMADELTALLAPFWAERDALEALGALPTPKRAFGDRCEEEFARLMDEKYPRRSQGDAEK